MSKSALSKYWSDCVHNLDPYIPGEQPRIADLIKLNTNENPYPPSPTALSVVDQDSVNALRLYPDPESTALRQTLADTYAVTPEEVFVGNGSDEVLGLAFKAFFSGHAQPLLFPDITYSFYPVYCGLFDIDYATIPLNAHFKIINDDYKKPNCGIIFPNPNAPTSIAKPLAEIESLLQQHPDVVVIIDEAYIDFGGQSAVPLVKQYPNLLITQTFSKSRSLAGSRVGYAIGQPHLIDGLNRVKNSFNSYPLDRIAQAMAIATLKDEDYFKDCCTRIISTRMWFTAALAQLGFYCLPSAANFVMARPPLIANDYGASAEQLFTALREHKILVRYFSKPRINEYLRITIGTNAEMEQCIKVLNDIPGIIDRSQTAPE